MGAIENTIEKRFDTSGVASDMLNKLKKKDKTNNISKISFPSNLENQAQATYMVIYVFDNTANKKSFSNTVFSSPIDEDSYEIGAITAIKNNLNYCEKEIAGAVSDAKKWVVKNAKSWLESVKEAETKDKTKEVETGTWNSIKDFANTYIIPKRKQDASRKLQDSLDPTKHPDSGYSLVKAIQIQMPSSSITYKYENGWESTNTESLNAIRHLLNGVGDLIGGWYSGDSKQVASGKQDLSSIWGKVKTSLGDTITGGGFSASKQAQGNFIYNPAIVFNYSIPSPRTFTYSFSLYPRNKTELYDLFNMIQLLKFYSLPEISASEKQNGGSQSMTYNYPAKFAIKFYTNGYENKWFPKTLTLGLTSIEETLTGDNGDMAYFENYFDKYSGNPPRMVNLSLSFKELGLMSRQAANEGY